MCLAEELEGLASDLVAQELEPLANVRPRETICVTGEDEVQGCDGGEQVGVDGKEERKSASGCIHSRRGDAAAVLKRTLISSRFRRRRRRRRP